MFRFSAGLSSIVFAALLAGCAGVKYSPMVTEQKSLPDVSVRVSHQADGIYRVQVRNNTSDNITLQWSYSAYVTTGGETIRLINIPDPDHFPEGVPTEQVPSMVVRGGRLTTWFVGESWIDYARRGVMPRPRDSESKAGIYLGFIIKGKKVYWKGEVSFVPQP
ncbi:MAG: hypothetical protein OEV35_06605 [Gallionellaceae bacterium]|nr:hypothetical protein [Gallionellaceae bacterium]